MEVIKMPNVRMNPAQIMKMYSEYRQDPIGFLHNMNIDIPNEYSNNPQGAVQHLMNNNQMSQTEFNNLYSQAQQFGAKF